jgi:hypothetical protein
LAQDREPEGSCEYTRELSGFGATELISLALLTCAFKSQLPLFATVIQDSASFLFLAAMNQETFVSSLLLNLHFVFGIFPIKNTKVYANWCKFRKNKHKAI